jgi:hypothetical protein
MRIRFAALLLAAATLAAAPRGARAQLALPAPDSARRPLRFFGGAEALYARPQGAFGRYVDHGWGASGHFLVALDRGGFAAVRLDGGFLNYGDETKRACLSTTIGCRIAVDVRTSNNIAFLGLGPQIMVPNGRFRPYVNGTAGFSYFFTQSAVEGSDNSSTFAQTTNFDDVVFSTAAGAGLYIPVRAGRTPISLDLGARYRWNGRTRYLREGSITDLPDGSIAISPIESRTDLVTYQIGVTFGAR